jgi:hypothetical protein
MPKTKRPALRVGDRVVLASDIRTPLVHAGKPAILRDTVLTVSSIGGRGTLRDPWTVHVTDGCEFWHFAPQDVTPAEEF